MKVIASRQMPIVNTHQVVWQPVTDNGDRSMRLAPIDWQPSGAHACIQMLVDDLRNAEAKLTKAVEALNMVDLSIMENTNETEWRLWGEGAVSDIRKVLAELDTDIYKDRQDIGT